MTSTKKHTNEFRGKHELQCEIRDLRLEVRGLKNVLYEIVDRAVTALNGGAKDMTFKPRQLKPGETGYFYHRTTLERWRAIQKEGVLWGISKSLKKSDWKTAHRYTYLAPTDWGESYGPVLLMVKYKPVGVNGLGIDNYGFNPPDGQHCVQFSVFRPIPLADVWRIE